MVAEKVVSYQRHFMAIQMNEPAAALTFKVITGLALCVAVSTCVFKAGGAVGIDRVFVYDTFIHKAFKSAVYREKTALQIRSTTFILGTPEIMMSCIS